MPSIPHWLMVADDLAVQCLHDIHRVVGHWEFYYGLADQMATLLRQGKVVKLTVVGGQPVLEVR